VTFLGKVEAPAVTNTALQSSAPQKENCIFLNTFEKKMKEQKPNFRSDTEHITYLYPSSALNPAPQEVNSIASRQVAYLSWAPDDIPDIFLVRESPGEAFLEVCLCEEGTGSWPSCYVFGIKQPSSRGVVFTLPSENGILVFYTLKNLGLTVLKFFDIQKYRASKVGVRSGNSFERCP